MISESRKKAQQKYDEKNCRHYGLKLNTKTDADIIKYIDTSGNKQLAIKIAIRYYLNNKGTE